jgi:glyoxylase-like metal-dependent hydrolase (beta-lactamase superfamily II)
MTDRCQSFSRRNFLAKTSCFGAFYALARLVSVPALAGDMARDPRVSKTLLLDKGFASVRKVGNGLYATISDPSKGTATLCNGGFLVGRDAALLLEGFSSVAGASFQMDALRMVSRVPVKAALDTHYHFDHSLGNAFYGGRGIDVWGHTALARRILDSYTPLQGADLAAVLGPFEKRVKDAKSDVERTHAQGDLKRVTMRFQLVNASLLALPNRALDPATVPLKIELGGLTAMIESYPGHSATDLVVRVPQQNVVYTGDLLFNGWYPGCYDEQATVSGWRETLKTFASWDKDTLFVPGHGQLCGQGGIAQLRDIFDDIAGQAETLFNAGVPVEEAQHRYIVPEKFKNLSIIAWGFTIGPAIAHLYAEWKQKK